MTRTGQERELTVPAAARRLGLPGEEVYRLIFAGHLDARRGPDGAVVLTAETVEGHLARRSADPDRV